MRREGKQHGMVRVVYILPPPLNRRPMGAKVINRFESPPTAGMFTRVPTKPTNHSKFTGKCKRAKCAGCHEHPVSKSKDKAKGSNKLRTSDGGFDPIYAGSSAAEMLANLSEECEDGFDEEIEDEEEVELDQAEVEECEDGFDEEIEDEEEVELDQAEVEGSSSNSAAAVEMVPGPVEIEDGWIEYVMEFEDWCLVD